MYVGSVEGKGDVGSVEGKGDVGSVEGKGDVRHSSDCMLVFPS